MTEPLDPFKDIDAQKACDKYLSLAQAQPEASIKPYRLVPDLVIYSIGKAMPALVKITGKIEAEFKNVKAAPLLELPELAMALKFAALDAERHRPARRAFGAAPRRGGKRPQRSLDARRRAKAHRGERRAPRLDRRGQEEERGGAPRAQR